MGINTFKDGESINPLDGGKDTEELKKLDKSSIHETEDLM